MGDKFQKHNVNKFAVSMSELQLIKKYYDCVSCRVERGGNLIAKGEITPTDYSATYNFTIKYSPYKTPKVFINNPIIEYNNDIHLYKDGSVCLYYPGDMIWNSTLHLHNTIIPWTAEWLIFYELYQITGKWEHPYVPHGELKTES